MSNAIAAGELLRIALCITELEDGGAERCLVELAVGLDREKFTPRVFCLGPRPPGASRLVERLERASIPVLFCDGRGAANSWRVFVRLRAMFREWRPHLVQTFLWHANVLGLLAARSAGVPRVVTSLRVAEPGRPWRRPVERWAGSRADCHVAVSGGVARFARERIGLAAEKIRVIANGIALERYPAEPVALTSLGIRPGRRAMLFVGRLDVQKGVDQLVSHAPELLASSPEHDLLVVGEGPRSASIERQVVALGLRERIHLLGRRNDVAEIMAAADVLLAPSRWEGMSNVVLEAMASGLAVVAFAAEGTDELLSPLTPHPIVAQGNWSAFIERAARFGADESLRNELGQSLRERALKDFVLSQMIARYEALYLELVGSNP
jgi:glycosyltransferase involved in cell wall biosynthesis